MKGILTNNYTEDRNHWLDVKMSSDDELSWIKVYQMKWHQDDEVGSDWIKRDKPEYETFDESTPRNEYVMLIPM